MDDPDYVVAISQCRDTYPTKTPEEILNLLKRGTDYIYCHKIDIEVGNGVLFIKVKRGSDE